MGPSDVPGLPSNIWALVAGIELGIPLVRHTLESLVEAMLFFIVGRRRPSPRRSISY